MRSSLTQSLRNRNLRAWAGYSLSPILCKLQKLASLALHVLVQVCNLIMYILPSLPFIFPFTLTALTLDLPNITLPRIQDFGASLVNISPSCVNGNTLLPWAGTIDLDDCTHAYAKFQKKISSLPEPGKEFTFFSRSLVPDPPVNGWGLPSGVSSGKLSIDRILSLV